MTGCRKERIAQELVRHGGHLLDWDARNEHGKTPLDSAALNAMAYPDDDTVPLYELYKSRVLPQGTQLVDRCRLADDAAEEVVDLTSTSLIQAGLAGNIKAIEILIPLGAMIDERNEAGRTLLRLVTMVAVNGFSIAIEVVPYGGYGVDWVAVTADG